jgi:class 3 adenylate cyclase
MDTHRLKTLFERLRQQHPVNAGEIDAVERWLHDAPLIRRYRINPHVVAADTALDAHAVIRVLLHGTQTGLFDMHWDVHCGHCNMLAEAIDDLAMAAAVSFCPMCAYSFDVDMAARVEVTFSLGRSIEDLGFPPVCQPPSALQPRYGITAALGETAAATEVLPAGRYRYFCPLTRAKGILRVEGEPTDEVQAVAISQLAGPHYDVTELAVRPGPLAIALTNVGWPQCGFIVHRDDLKDELDPASLPRRLSGLELLHVPEYRRYFGGMVLSARERLTVRSVLVVFTDLCGSTRLYERIGDAPAYNLVRDHFDIVIGAVEAQGGAVVKTIGDAVMATFLDERSAVTALSAAMRGMLGRNAGRPEGERLVLRAGMHRGPALLVNLNQRLDYFGRSVNTAARMLGVSAGGELTVSAPLAADAELVGLLTHEGWTPPRASHVDLKGIEGTRTVHSAGFPGMAAR